MTLTAIQEKAAHYARRFIEARTRRHGCIVEIQKSIEKSGLSMTATDLRGYANFLDSYEKEQERLNAQFNALNDLE